MLGIGASTGLSRLVLLYYFDSLIFPHCLQLQEHKPFFFYPPAQLYLTLYLKLFDPRALEQCPSLCPLNYTSPMKKLLYSRVRLLTADCIATLIPAEVGTSSVLAAAPMGILSETAMSSTPTTGSSEDVLLQHGAPHSWALQGSNKLNLSCCWSCSWVLGARYSAEENQL